MRKVPGSGAACLTRNAIPALGPGERPRARCPSNIFRGAHGDERNLPRSGPSTDQIRRASRCLQSEAPLVVKRRHRVTLSISNIDDHFRTYRSSRMKTSVDRVKRGHIIADRYKLIAEIGADEPGVVSFEADDRGAKCVVRLIRRASADVIRFTELSRRRRRANGLPLSGLRVGFEHDPWLVLVEDPEAELREPEADMEAFQKAAFALKEVHQAGLYHGALSWQSVRSRGTKIILARDVFVQRELLNPAPSNRYIWHLGNSGRALAKAGTQKPNGFKLFDMLGSVMEWTADTYPGTTFSVIPFKGRPVKAAAADDRPKNHVRALSERKAMEMRFAVVEAYAFALRKNLIRCDVDGMPALDIEPNREPTATFVRPTVGYAEGSPSTNSSPFPFDEQNREECCRGTHLQTIEFQIARLIVDQLTVAGGDAKDRRRRVLALQSRHQVFPQVFRYVDDCAPRARRARPGPQRYAAEPMRAGPSEPACRSRFQTTSGGCGQKPWS